MQATKEEERFKNLKDIFSTKEDFYKLELKIEQTKSDLVKWMFLFWASSVVATLGGLLAIVKFMVAK